MRTCSEHPKEMEPQTLSIKVLGTDKSLCDCVATGRSGTIRGCAGGEPAILSL